MIPANDSLAPGSVGDWNSILLLRNPEAKGVRNTDSNSVCVFMFTKRDRFSFGDEVLYALFRCRIMLVLPLGIRDFALWFDGSVVVI